MKKKSLVLIFTLSVVVSSAKSFGSSYNFGYACATNGSWTQSALNESNKLISILNTLKDDENCKGFEVILGELLSSQARFKKNVESNNSSDTNIGDGIDEDNSEAQKSMLNQVIQKGIPEGEKGPFYDLLAGVHVTSAVNKTLDFTSKFSAKYFKPDQVMRGLDQSATELSNVVNEALTSMVGPKLDQCLVESPNQGMVMVAAMLRLVANTSVPGVSGAANRIGETLNNFVQYLRQAKFGKVLRNMKQTELWASITCALESSAENYCTVKNQLKLLNWGLSSMEQGATPGVSGIEFNGDGNFLVGYHTLMRNVPVIAKWLLKVQFGVEPKLITDATYKNSIWSTVLGIIETMNQINALYNEFRRNIENSTDPSTRKNMIFTLLDRIKHEMSGAVVASGGSEINFFTNSFPINFLSLRLVGLEESQYPKDVLPKESGLIIRADDWLQNGGRYREMFNDQIALMDIVKIQLEKIMGNVETEMRKYFIDRLIVDKMNLVAEAFTIDSMTTSVNDSLLFIIKYLEGLRIRIQSSPFGDPQVVNLIDDTLEQISAVYVAIANYGKVKHSAGNAKKAAEDVIEVVYEKFNVLIQRDSFITNRMATIVHYDYFLQILENKNMDQYARELMILSNNDLYRTIAMATTENPAMAEQDYYNASMINRRNLDNVEYIFRNNFMDFLQTTTFDANGVSDVGRNLKVMKNIYHDNILALPKSIFGYKYRYQFNLINPFDPFYRRGTSLFSNGGDTDEGAFIANKNRVCIQLLASPNPRKIYMDLCADAKIVSPFYAAATDEEKRAKLEHLNVKFIEFTKYFNKKSDDDRICAYRDYMYINHVHWMTLQHEQIKKHKKESVVNGTKADEILNRAQARLGVKNLSKKESELKELQKQVSTLDMSEKKLRNDIKSMESKIARRKESLKELKESKSTPADELTQLRKEISDLEDKLAALQDQLTEIELEKDDITKKITTVQSSVLHIKSEIR